MEGNKLDGSVTIPLSRYEELRAIERDSEASAVKHAKEKEQSLRILRNASNAIGFMLYVVGPSMNMGGVVIDPRNGSEVDVLSELARAGIKVTYDIAAGGKGRRAIVDFETNQ